jgi:enoyl-CoA hydratase/3-hydroxyacyl-CoA dehydrogenase
MTAQVASDLGLLTHLVDVSAVESCISDCAKSGKPENKYPGVPAQVESQVAKFASQFYSDSNMKTLLAGQCPEGFDSEDKIISRQLKNLKFTAPIALSMASDLINATATNSLEDGLDMELSKLHDIFATNDALEGLSALIEGRRPTYNNS